ncbi:MAG: WD40/YVTN/BNR-like repeat-containing protein [Halodesulfurarchaeum sp.]
MPTVFAAFEDRLLEISRTDGEWTAETILSGPEIESVTGRPEDSGRVLVGTVGDGILLRDAWGDSWHRVGAETIDDRVTALATDSSDIDRVYAGTEPSAVYASTDGGETWRRRGGLRDLPSATSWSFPPRPHTHHVRWIEVDPANPAHLYVAIEAGALVQTEDRGKTWTDRVPSARRDVHSMATHPDAPGRAWCAAGDGFAETTDGGATWEYPQSGLDHRYCWSVAVDPADPDRVVVSGASGPGSAHTPGTAESYVYRRKRGNGEGMGQDNAGGETQKYKTDRRNWEPDGRNWEPDGRDWELAEDGIPHGTGMLRPVLASGTDPGEIFAVTNRGVYRSESAGQYFRKIAIHWPSELREQTPAGVHVVS